MIRSGIFVAALGLLGYWYVAQKPETSPDTEPKPSVTVVDGVKIEYDTQVEKFPAAPPEVVQKLLEPLSGLFTQHPNDALEMARATQHFARNVRKNPKLTTIGQLNQLRTNSLDGLFQGSLPLQGSYPGKIDPVSREVADFFLSPHLKDGEGNVTSTKLDEASRNSLGDYFDAMSWKFSTEYLKSITSPKEVK